MEELIYTELPSELFVSRLQPMSNKYNVMNICQTKCTTLFNKIIII